MCRPPDGAQIVPRGTILIASFKSKKVACQGGIRASGGMFDTSICAFFRSCMHREGEANCFEQNEHFWRVGSLLVVFRPEPLRGASPGRSSSARRRGDQKGHVLFPLHLSPTVGAKNVSLVNQRFMTCLETTFGSLPETAFSLLIRPEDRI